MSLIAKNSKLSRTIPLIGIAVAGIAAIFGSGPVNFGTPSGYLTINYEIRTEPDPSTMISNVTSGAYGVGFYLTPGRCEFDADFNLGPLPNINLIGNPGEVGANVVINAQNPTPRPTSSSECRQLSDINIVIGGLNTALNLGVSVNKTSASLVADGPGLPPNATFTTTGGYFEGTLNSFNSSTGYFTGEFEFIATGPGDLVFIATGTYGSD